MEIAYGVNTGNEAYSAAEVLSEFVLITRLSSHAAIGGSTQACSIWVCCSRCAVLSGGLGLPPSLCGLRAPQPASPLLGHGVPTRTPPLGLAIVVPCGPVLGCCDTPGRLRLVGTLLAVRRRTMTNSTLSFHSFTLDDVQRTTCLD